MVRIKNVIPDILNKTHTQNIFGQAQNKYYGDTKRNTQEIIVRHKNCIPETLKHDRSGAKVIYHKSKNMTGQVKNRHSNDPKIPQRHKHQHYGQSQKWY